MSLTAVDWLVPGRKTVEGWLLVVRGSLKRSHRRGLFEELVMLRIEETRPGTFPRHPDLYAVWFGKDEAKEPNHQYEWPILRYRRPRPIDGLRAECSGHKVRLTCTVGKPYQNGLGAPITRAVGECLECSE